MVQQHWFIPRIKPDMKLDGENIYRKKGGLDAAEVLTRYQLQDRAVVEKGFFFHITIYCATTKKDIARGRKKKVNSSKY